MLTAYLARTTQLLQNPAAPSTLYATADLTSYINQARGQLAGETSCIRALGTLVTAAGTISYNFSAITGLGASVAGVFHVRGLVYTIAPSGTTTGYKWIRPRPWEWYFLYKLANPVQPTGAPTVWSQFGQGGSGAGSITGIGTGTMASGSLFLDPIPDLVYSLLCDVACYPIALTADTDVEAIPFLFTDAVPYFAAYLALMSAQTNARLEYAQRMFELYQTFVDRANKASAPDVNRFLYERQSDGTSINKLGIQKAAGGGQ